MRPTLCIGLFDIYPQNRTRGIEMPKSSPDVVVRRALDALEAGADEVLADDITRQVKQGLSAEPGVYLLAA